MTPENPISRREYLASMGAIAGAIMWRGAWPASVAPFGGARPGFPPPGLQLYTIRTSMRESVSDSLARVSALGYREVEFAGYFGVPPDEIRDLLARYDLASPATHVGLEAVESSLDDTLASAVAAGHEWVVVPWLPAERRRTPDDWATLAGVFNRVGETARSAGVRFAYHNHASEFEPMDGTTGFEILLEETDPLAVDFELDVFWITHGGGDPLAMLDRHPDRFPLLHIKDRAADGRMVDVGLGAIDWPEIFARAETAGMRHYFVEHDEPEDPWESIGRSLQYVESLS